MKQNKIKAKAKEKFSVNNTKIKGKTPFDEYKKLEEQESAFLKSLTLEQAIKLTEVVLRGAEEWSKCSKKSKQYYVRRS